MPRISLAAAADLIDLDMEDEVSAEIELEAGIPDAMHDQWDIDWLEKHEDEQRQLDYEEEMTRYDPSDDYYYDGYYGWD